MKHEMTQNLIMNFKDYLICEEKSSATLEKYLRDVNAFFSWIKDGEVDKGIVINYKEYLIDRFATASVNSIISSLNSFFGFAEWYDCKVRTIKVQKKIFCTKEKEPSKSEYEKLLKAALNKKNKRLYYIMQTICSSGIRISELRYITVEAVKRGWADVRCKGKNRNIILPKDLCLLLNEYIHEEKLKQGSVFVSKKGNPLDRSNIWKEMRKLCKDAGVAPSKVFPHNLRHLFARTYYSLQKDIVRLADILGHSSVNTTRIYTIECGDVHRRQIQRLGLIHLRI